MLPHKPPMLPAVLRCTRLWLFPLLLLLWLLSQCQAVPRLCSGAGQRCNKQSPPSTADDGDTLV